MSAYKRPTVRRPARAPEKPVVLVMPNYKWSKLATYTNGSKNLFHNNRATGIRTIVHLQRGQSLKQYFNTYKGFPTGVPIPGYTFRPGVREEGEILTAMPIKRKSPPKKKTPSPSPSPSPLKVPKIKQVTEAAKRFIRQNNNLYINQYGTFLNNNTTVRNLVSKAVTKAKLREILTKNLNAGYKKMQAKMKGRSNRLQAISNKQREAEVRNLVNQIMKRVVSQHKNNVNLTTRKRTPGYTWVVPQKKVNNKPAGPAPKKKPEGYNEYKKKKGYTNLQLNTLLNLGLVNENNLVANRPALRKYNEPARKSASIKKTTKKETSKTKVVVTKKTGPANNTPKKESNRAERPPMSNLLIGQKVPSLPPPPPLPKRKTEELIKQAINKVVTKPSSWTNAEMMNHKYKRGPGFKFGGTDCETKTKEELVSILRKYGYSKPLPSHYTKAVLCQKLKLIHNSYKGVKVNAGNNNHLKKWLSA